MCTVIEFAENGNLRDLIDMQKMKKEKFSDQIIIKWFK